MALQQVESLSGGQKSRVAFAVLCGHNPNFLVLGKIVDKCSMNESNISSYRRTHQSS